jgi:hypothetical protein
MEGKTVITLALEQRIKLQSRKKPHSSLGVRSRRLSDYTQEEEESEVNPAERN